VWPENRVKPDSKDAAGEVGEKQKQFYAAALHTRSDGLQKILAEKKQRHGGKHCPNEARYKPAKKNPRPVDFSHYPLLFNAPVLSISLFSFRFPFHFYEAGVVIGDFVQMSEGDFAGQDGVVAGYVRGRVGKAVFQFHVQPHPELLHVEALPINAQHFADLAGLLGGELFFG
jgi:hypothetical protein